MKEEWKKLHGKTGITYPQYEVSNLGNLRRSFVGRTKQVKGSLSAHSHTQYLKVNLSNKGKKTHDLIHRLVAQAWIPNPENKPLVNHKDFNGANNHIDNLEWVTYKENMQHSADNGKPDKRKLGTTKRVTVVKNKEFEENLKLIGTIYIGRKLIGLSYLPNKASKWHGIFKCTYCNKEFSSPLHQTITRFKQGKKQYCSKCRNKPLLNTISDEDIVKPA